MNALLSVALGRYASFIISCVFFTKCIILQAPAKAKEQKRMTTFANKQIRPLYNNN